MDPNTTMGPLVSAKQKERVLGYIASGKADAKLVYGGEEPKDLNKGHFVGPAIFDQVQNSMKIAREEIFGPVLSIITFKEEGEALALVWTCRIHHHPRRRPCPARRAGDRGGQRVGQHLGRGELDGSLWRI
jgi:acyl-CoA reductase-like NAD-dependent aldehyde dehydrogenase